MISFSHVAPTEIIFGIGKEKEIGSILKKRGYRNVIFVYGGSSIKRLGLYDSVTSSLKESGIDFHELPGVRPNPVRTKVAEGVALAKQYQADAILAVGGGSVIDTSKAIAAGFYYEGDAFDFNLKKAVPEKALPIGVILTHSSAGSELSSSCVIQDDETQVKQGFNSDLVRPDFVVENPELTYSVSSYQTAAGVADTMMHTMERFFLEPTFGDFQLSDDWALALIKNVMEAGKVVSKDPTNYEARSAIMLASSLSHCGITGLGKEGRFVVHPLEHALSGYMPSITHGAGIALLYPAWAEHVYRLDLPKFARLGRYLFNLGDADDETSAIMGINLMREYFSSIGMPTSFEEVGLSEKDVAPLADLVTGNGTRVVGRCPKPLDRQDAYEIYASLVKKGASK